MELGVNQEVQGPQREEGLCVTEGGREPWWSLDKSQDLSSRLSEPKPLLATQTANPQKPRPPWRLLCVIRPWCPVSQTLSQPLLHHLILSWGHSDAHSTAAPVLPSHDSVTLKKQTYPLTVKTQGGQGWD